MPRIIPESTKINPSLSPCKRAQALPSSPKPPVPPRNGRKFLTGTSLSGRVWGHRSGPPDSRRSRPRHERDASDPGTDPIELGRLRKKEDGMPYSGEVLRYFLSGKLEHYSNYQNGFRVGTAYWWDENGLVTKAMKGWGGNSEEFDPSGVSPNPYDTYSEMLGSVDPSQSEAFISGNAKRLEGVGMGNDRNRFGSALQISARNRIALKRAVIFRSG